MLSFNAFTQNTQVDSLILVTDTTTNIEVKIHALIDLGDLSRRTNAEKSFKYLLEAEELAKKKNDRKLITLVNMSKMPVMAYNGKLDSAILIGLDGLDFYTQEEDVERVLYCYNSLAILNRISGKQEKALEYCEQGILKSDDYPEMKAGLLMNSANIYHQLGNFKSAIDNNLEALAIWEEVKSEDKIGLLYNNIGLLYEQQKDYDKALYYYRTSLDKIKNSDNESGRIVAYYNMGKVYDKIGERDSTLLAYQKALGISEKIGYKRYIIASKCKIALHYSTVNKLKKAEFLIEELSSEVENMIPLDKKTYLSTQTEILKQKGNFKKALEVFKEVIKISNKENNLDSAVDEMNKLSELYMLTGNYKKGYEYHVKFKNLNDSLINQDNLSLLKIKKAEYEFNQEKLETEKNYQIEKALVEKSNRIRNISLISALLALVLVFGWGITIYKANNQGKKYAAKLEKTVIDRTADLKDANGSLEQANYELRTFNYIASHDIKEPIRNIGGYVSLIKRKLPEGIKNELKEYFEIISNSSAQLYTLIEDFAHYTSLSQKEEIETNPTDINKLVNNVKDSLMIFINDKNGQVNAEKIPMINSSNSALYVILKNLIENGIKYNTAEKPIVDISYQTTEISHQIIVSDNGIGMDEKYHEQIFEMFKRLHNRSVYQGTGIGLAIVKLMTEKLNGTVQVKSEKGKGSSFILNFPKV